MQAAEQYLLSEEDYLAAEHQHPEKHEWYQGECFAMAGGTRWHNLLASRILAELVRHLDGKKCTPYRADLRLLIEAHRHYVYPDVMVICDEAAYLADDMAKDAEIYVYDAVHCPSGRAGFPLHSASEMSNCALTHPHTL